MKRLLWVLVCLILAQSSFAATYYCDLGQNFAAKSGADKTGNQLLGPGGLQAAIRGDGAGPVTQLAAGDILEIKGTGNLSLLVDITCGKDVSAWAAGDVVRDNTAGNHWTGVVVQEFDEVATGLTDNTHLLVQIDSTATYDDLNDNQADGIENTTQADTTTIGGVACPGIYIDGNSGDTTTGHIHIIGCDAAWAARAGQAVLDGADDDATKTATNCIKFYAKNYWAFEYITFQNALDSGVDTDGNFVSYLQFRHCLFTNNSGSGVDSNLDFTNPVFIRCIFRANTLDGYANGRGGTSFMFGCVVAGNSQRGVEAGSSMVISDSLFYENVGDNLELTGVLSFVAHSVFDAGGVGATASGIMSGGNDDYNLIVGNRFTNCTDHGIEQTSAAGNQTSIEDWNVFDTNTNGDLQNIIGGLNSYGDHGNHIANPADDGYDAAADHYEVVAAKEYSARNAADEIELNWDGTPAGNNSVWITAGLAIEAPAGGGAVRSPVGMTGGLN